MKGNTEKCFDCKVLEKLNLRNKLFKKFKKSRLHIDKELYKNQKYDTLKLIASKKQKQLTKPNNYGTPLNLWLYQTKSNF